MMLQNHRIGPEPLRHIDETTLVLQQSCPNQLRAVSLNRGELRNLETAQPGWRPGWDLAGEVLARAADGSGPPVGARVVGLLRAGAWAERVAVPTHQLARRRPRPARPWRPRRQLRQLLASADHLQRRSRPTSCVVVE